MPAVADQRTPGWFWCHDRLIDTYGPELGPIGIAVYVCLARHADKAGECFPAKATIAAEIGASKRAVDEAISRLVTFKLITFTKRKAAPGDHDSNLYTLLEPPRFIVIMSTETAVDAIHEGVSTSPSLDSPLTVFPSGAGGALPGVQEVHHPPAPPAGGGAGDALPPWQKDGSQIPTQPEFPNLTASVMSENPWEQMKGFMRLQLPRGTYESWLRDTTLVKTTEDEYTVRVHDANARDWLTQRLGGKIAANLQTVAGHPINVKYVTAQELTQSHSLPLGGL
jgi:hypothetical protein